MRLLARFLEGYICFVGGKSLFFRSFAAIYVSMVKLESLELDMKFYINHSISKCRLLEMNLYIYIFLCGLLLFTRPWMGVGGGV